MVLPVRISLFKLSLRSDKGSGKHHLPDVFSLSLNNALREKCPNTDFFWSVFSVFGLNREKYFVSLRIQSECGKIQTRKNSVFGYLDTFHAVMAIKND